MEGCPQLREANIQCHRAGSILLATSPRQLTLEEGQDCQKGQDCWNKQTNHPAGIHSSWDHPHPLCPTALLSSPQGQQVWDLLLC